VLVNWENGTETWEPLSIVAKDDPVILAKYVGDHELLDTPGWKRFRHLAKNEKKINQMMKQV